MDIQIEILDINMGKKNINTDFTADEKESIFQYCIRRSADRTLTCEEQALQDEVDDLQDEVDDIESRVSEFEDQLSDAMKLIKAYRAHIKLINNPETKPEELVKSITEIEKWEKLI